MAKRRRKRERAAQPKRVAQPAAAAVGTPAPPAADHSKAARIKVLRQQRQRTSRIRWLLGGSGGLVLVGALLWFSGVGQPDVGVAARSEGGVGVHIGRGQPLSQVNRPPSSGPHYAARATYGVSSQPIEPGSWIHALEHGAIAVLYKCNGAEECARTGSELRKQVYEPARNGRLGERKLVIAPYTDMDAPITAVAWGRVLELPTLDAVQILAFYERYLDRGPEQAP
ncbi:MAG: DUF3105 domain-containing protein [Candidatus Limnocylindria bacterium]